MRSARRRGASEGSPKTNDESEGSPKTNDEYEGSPKTNAEDERCAKTNAEAERCAKTEEEDEGGTKTREILANGTGEEIMCKGCLTNDETKGFQNKNVYTLIGLTGPDGIQDPVMAPCVHQAPMASVSNSSGC